MANPNLRLVSPATENRTVTPQRPPNADLRTREHLTADEVDELIEAAKANRSGYRDALMVLLAYRHGLRAAEVVDLHPIRPAKLKLIPIVLPVSSESKKTRVGHRLTTTYFLGRTNEAKEGPW